VGNGLQTRFVVIVSCPACHTQYRHRQERPKAKLARCSRCNEVFPLESAKQGYKLMRPTGTVAAGAGARRMTIGMDDPLLAAKLQKTAMDATRGQSPPAMTYRVMNEAGTADGEATPEQTTTKSAVTPPVDAGADAPARRSRQVLVALLLGSAGAALGYYGFIQGLYTFADRYVAQYGLPPGPYPWMGFGGVLGLSVAWVWIRRTGRKR
jgi:predicted Zn finger-like uncharacterized protein